MLTVDKFGEYLLASIPENYPISSIPLSLNMTEAHRKELIFQQSKFLQQSMEFLQKFPWITFLASVKHIYLLKLIETTTANFKEITDKEYFDKIQHDCIEIFNAADSVLDDDTKASCIKIVKLQIYNAHICSVIDVCKKAINARIPSFTNPPAQPVFEGDSPVGCSGCLIVILVAVIFLITAAITQLGVMTLLSFLVFIGGGIIWAAINKPKWDAQEAAKIIFKQSEARYNNFNSLKDVFYSELHKFADDLELDINAMGSDLKYTVEILEFWLNEKKTLEDGFIAPYI